MSKISERPVVNRDYASGLGRNAGNQNQPTDLISHHSNKVVNNE